MFFFSSRRRHTRCYRDWSSDVCSSDLHSDSVATLTEWLKLYSSVCLTLSRRSEERRVGKECRSPWWTDRKKKKRVSALDHLARAGHPQRWCEERTLERRQRERGAGQQR